jgi:hypothetical protein
MPTPKRHENAAARQQAYRERRKLGRLSSLSSRNLPLASAIAAIPSTARWKELRRQAEAALKTLLDEMENYQDQRSENWQEGDKGQAFQEVIDRAEEALDAVRNID